MNCRTRRWKTHYNWLTRTPTAGHPKFERAALHWLQRTLTLWGADLAPLSAKGKRAPSAIASFASRFKAILQQLRAAAPTAEIIVTGAWNPEADRLKQTMALYRSLGAAIGRAAAGSRARVANMFAAFNGSGNIQSQKARLCRLTFSCKGDPHPTDAGYRAMADAFMAASGYPRNP